MVCECNSMQTGLIQYSYIYMTILSGNSVTLSCDAVLASKPVILLGEAQIFL